MKKTKKYTALKPGKDIYSCKYCSKVFKWKRSLIKHMKAHAVDVKERSSVTDRVIHTSSH